VGVSQNVIRNAAGELSREVLITAARQRARGISWEIIAKETPHSAGELCRFAVKHPEAWRPLYVRAEKLRLQEAEGRTLAHLTALLKGDDETAAEKAGRELLIHRRHVERSRGDMYRKSAEGGSGTCPPTAEQNGERWFAQDPAPEELHRPILYAANRVAHGEDYAAIAREVGCPHEEIARWAFIYAKTWDRAYWPARLEAAEFGAALAINRLLDLVAGPDAALAARAGRTLLIHRRHMHWARNNPPQRHRDTEEDVSLDAAEASSKTNVLLRDPKGISVPQCLCGERGWRIRDGPQ